MHHTADVAVRAFGRSVEDLFESAAWALFGVMVEKTQNRPRSALTEREISVSGPSSEDLLKAWLDELLFLFSTEHLVLVRVKFKELGDFVFQARVLFETYDPEFYALKEEVKAVTYHQLEVRKFRQQWQADVIFDV